MLSTIELLSERLRGNIREQHHVVSRGSFLTRLTGGELSRAAYTDWISQLWYIYTALEETVCRFEASPLVSCLCDERLQRTRALETDLAHLAGADWLDHVEALPSTTAYVDRLFAIDNDEPAVIAHHYVRYLGDLTAGQFISRKVAGHYGIGPAGLHFSDFTELGTLERYQADYRSLVDTLPLTRAQEDALFAEANTALALNHALFEELGARHVPR